MEYNRLQLEFVLNDPTYFFDCTSLNLKISSMLFAKVLLNAVFYLFIFKAIPVLVSQVKIKRINKITKMHSLQTEVSSECIHLALFLPACPGRRCFRLYFHKSSFH